MSRTIIALSPETDPSCIALLVGTPPARVAVLGREADARRVGGVWPFATVVRVDHRSEADEADVLVEIGVPRGHAMYGSRRRWSDAFLDGLKQLAQRVRPTQRMQLSGGMPLTDSGARSRCCA